MKTILFLIYFLAIGIAQADLASDVLANNHGFAGWQTNAGKVSMLIPPSIRNRYNRLITIHGAKLNPIPKTDQGITPCPGRPGLWLLDYEHVFVYLKLYEFEAPRPHDGPDTRGTKQYRPGKDQ